jgi:hypothetical protein
MIARLRRDGSFVGLLRRPKDRSGAKQLDGVGRAAAAVAAVEGTGAAALPAGAFEPGREAQMIEQTRHRQLAFQVRKTT